MSEWSRPGRPDPPTRRAPFSSNPEVGERGRRSQERIVDAAMRCFAELGYERATVQTITDAAGCSRAAFYQYFSSKEELFRQVAGRATSELDASVGALGPVTADPDGWDALWRWVSRHDAIYDRYEPLFRAYDVAVELDDRVAGGTAVLTERYARELRAKVVGSTLPEGSTTAVITLLNRLVTRTRRISRLLSTTPEPTALDDARIARAVTDVLHRTLFGTSRLNARDPVPSHEARRDDLSATFRSRLDAEDVAAGLSDSARRTIASLLDGARETLLANGYHRTAVSAITAAAGQSHGIFYHYFSGKQEVTRVLAVDALRQLAEALVGIPDLGGTSPFDPHGLRRWLREYGRSHSAQAAMIRVWIEATEHDDELLAESAAGLEWGRRWMADVLEPRGFGDPAADGLVLITLLELLGASAPSDAQVEATALCIERGLVGVDREPSGG